jgi:lipid-A-disaccharide synthase-like uncharacterized protein
MVMINTFWVGFGFVGQFFFFMRFLLQWIASERHGKSIIPVAFWYFSIIGSLMLLTYAIQRRDPVFIVGQSTGTFIYLRNLILIHREKRTGRSPENGAAQP